MWSSPSQSQKLFSCKTSCDVSTVFILNMLSCVSIHTLQICLMLNAQESRGVSPPKIQLNFQERRTQHTRMMSRQGSKSVPNLITDLVYADTKRCCQLLTSLKMCLYKGGKGMKTASTWHVWFLINGLCNCLATLFHYQYSSVLNQTITPYLFNYIPLTLKKTEQILSETSDILKAENHTALLQLF